MSARTREAEAEEAEAQAEELELEAAELELEAAEAQAQAEELEAAELGAETQGRNLQRTWSGQSSWVNRASPLGSSWQGTCGTEEWSPSRTSGSGARSTRAPAPTST